MTEESEAKLVEQFVDCARKEVYAQWQRSSLAVNQTFEILQLYQPIFRNRLKDGKTKKKSFNFFEKKNKKKNDIIDCSTIDY